MPTPQESAASIFRNAMDSGFDPVKLAGLRDKRKRELEDQLIADESAAANPGEHYVQGEPGRRASNSGSMNADVIRTRGLLGQVTRDMDEDPYTGRDEHDRNARIQNTLDEAAMVQRPEVGDAAKTVTNRNAFAEFMKSKEGTRGKFAAEVSPEGDQALDAASKRRASELGVRWQAQGKGMSRIPQLRPGEDPLAGLSPQDAAEIRALAAYELPATGSQLRTPEWQDKVGRAMILDPSFDPSLYESRQKMRSDPKFRENMQSLGTIEQHLTETETGAAKLNNSRFKPVNAFKNWFGDLTGDKDVQSYGVAQNTAATEMPRALKGDAPTIPEIEEWKRIFGANKSPEGQAATFGAARHVLQRRVEEARHSYDARMGRHGAYDEYMRSIDTVEPPGGSRTASAPVAPAGWKYVPKPGGGWTAVQVP